MNSNDACHIRSSTISHQFCVLEETFLFSNLVYEMKTHIILDHPSLMQETHFHRRPRVFSFSEWQQKPTNLMPYGWQTPKLETDVHKSESRVGEEVMKKTCGN